LGAIGKKQGGLELWVGLGGQHGVVARGVETKDDFGAGRFFQAQTIGADGHPAVGADFERSADTPDIRPPRTTRGWAQRRAFFRLGLVPGPLGSLAQLPMDFVGVVVCPQGVNVRVGDGDFADFLAGKVGGQPPLPKLVFAFDFAFGLRGGGIAQADVVELERPAQLGEGVWIVGEEETVIIDVELEGPAMGQEGGGEEVKVGEQAFALIEFGTREKTAAVIQHVEHGAGQFGVGEPAMGRSIQLPEFANAVALPAAHRGQHPFGRDGMRQLIGQSPTADLGAVELEVMQAQGFGGHKAVRAWRGAAKPFAEEIQNEWRPGDGVIAAGMARDPEVFDFSGAGSKISGGKDIEPAARDAKLISGLDGRQGASIETIAHVADKCRCQPVAELLVVFRAGRIPGGSCPALLTTQLVLLCSPRDKGKC
jgi:hypothetical protein